MIKENGKINMRTPEEKEQIILEYYANKTGIEKFCKSKGITTTMLYRWINKYDKQGLEGLISKTGMYKGKNKGRPKKVKTKEEELERENIKLRIEIERLKKGYLVKGVGAKKEYVTIKDVNMK